MKWAKAYPNDYWRDGRIKYVCGEYSIMRTNHKNIWTGKVMTGYNNGWEIKKNGEKIGYELTLKEAKRFVEEVER